MENTELQDRGNGAGNIQDRRLQKGGTNEEKGRKWRGGHSDESCREDHITWV